MRKIILFLTFFTALFFIGCDMNDKSYTYSDWDFDDDGSVNEVDFERGIGEHGVYNDWDSNDDGVLDENEWTVGRDKYYSDYDGTYADWDLDNNKTINENEFSDGLFGYFDADDDGTLSETEYNDRYKNM